MQRAFLSATALLALAAMVGCMQRGRAETAAASAAMVATPAVAVGNGPRPIGAWSCASAGCHGDAIEGETRDWRSAYTVWSEVDPHRRAFAVLYSDRAVETYRNLAIDQRRTPAHLLDEARYFAFLKDKCIGCHATGPSRAASHPSELLAGIGCESCHGSASQWVDSHYLQTFPRITPGFVDLANLGTRAGVCVQCHIGPLAIGEDTFDVNHDLIAAGHPRLTFELDAYLQNYPQHWSAADDEDRHRRGGGSYHVDAWRFGQAHAARKLFEQVAHRQDTGWPDFASYDCFDCHHSLGARPATEKSEVESGVPHLSMLSLDLFSVAAASDANPSPDAARILEQHERLATLPFTSEKATVPIIDSGASLLEPCPRAHLPQHAAALEGWIGPRRSPSWDEAVAIYLAVQALRRDLPDDQPLGVACDALAAALNQYQLTQYDAPVEFRPADVQPALEALVTELRRLSGSVPATSGQP